MEPQPSDTLDALEATLRRRESVLARYVALRAWLGLGLVVVALALGAFTALVAAGQGAWVPFAPAWSTTGLGRVVVTGMAAVLALITGRAGIAFWRARTPDKDTGCLLG